MWRRLGPREIHFLMTLVLIAVGAVLQAAVLGRAGSLWLRVDVVTLLVVYISVEHFLLPALAELVFAAIMVHAFSAAPAFFYVMYFVLVLATANLVSRRVALWSLPSQFALFIVMLILKHALLLLALWRMDVKVDLVRYLLEVWPGLGSSCIVAIPVFRLLARLDERFESSRPHESPTLAL